VKPLALVLVLAALAPALAACGDKAVSAGPLPTVTDPAEGDTSGGGTTAPTSGGTTAPTPAASRVYQVWFTRGDALALTWQEGEGTRAVAGAALERLLAGPTETGDSTAIPEGTRLLGINLENGVATVDLSSEFESGGGSRSMFMRLAQVVYTVTQFDTVKSVRFRLDGADVDVFSSEGIVLDKPLTRKNYEDLLPPIVVESPASGETVSSPFTVSGFANVFEANVTLRLLDASGQELVHTFTTATCGTGCVGTFEKALSFAVDGAQAGVLVVADDDADGDGKPSHEVRIPLRLEP
jgi:germination protein M